MTPRIEALFGACLENGRFVQQLQQHEHKATMRGQWKFLRKRIGMTHINMHDFRRTLATRAYAKTKDLRVAQALLGHEHLSSTVHYIAPFDEHQLTPILRELTQHGRKGQRIQ